MKSELTLTDKLMIALLAVSILTALLHGTLSAVVTAGVHLTVTVWVSIIHIKGLKPQDVRVVQIKEEVNS